MLDALKIINDNKALIDRFVNLCLCKDKIYDSRHRWFYTLISLDRLKAIKPFLDKKDIRAEIHLHLIQSSQNYKNTYFEFYNYIKKSIGWYIKDYLLKIERLHRQDNTYYNLYNTNLTYTTNTNDSILDLNWVLTDKSVPLDSYDKYLLYLYCDKCYTIDQIQSIVYQEKTTLQRQLNSIKKIMRNYYAPKN